MSLLRRGPASITPEVLIHRLDRLAGQWLRPTPSEAVPMEGTPSEPRPDDRGADDGAPSMPPPVAEPSGRTGRFLLPDRSSLRVVLLIVAVAAVVVGWMWWQGQPRPVVEAPVTIAEGGALASTASGQVVVHVTGAVREPGLVRLPAGSRVDDAIAAAGGARSPKALGTVNLARVLVDGEQILVGGSPGEPTSASGDVGINLNQASASQLEELPGVGPVLAQRIIDWRTANGPFRSIDELGEVSGIGDSLLAQIRSLARV